MKSMKKIVFWEQGTRNEGGNYTGAVITDPENIFEAIFLEDFPLIYWSDKTIDQAPEVNWDKIDTDNYESLKEALDVALGSESEWAVGMGAERLFDVTDLKTALMFDMEFREFFTIDDGYYIYSHPAYSYFKNGNLTFLTYSEELDVLYQLYVTDTYILDVLDYNTGDRTWGGIGEHAILTKVRNWDTEELLLMHLWSQWQGSELDLGYFLTPEEAVEELEDHPELEEIKAWLGL